MQRAKIDKTILDSLIRAKLATLEGCSGVEAMPVAPRERRGTGCNWHIPGWTGDASRVGACMDRMGQYLSFLQAQFDIPEDDPERGRR